MNLKVEDHYPSGKRFLLRFKEKGGKEKELPVHHKLEELLDQYLKATGLEKEPGSPLFPAALGKTGKLSRRPLVRTDAADMLKRRLKQTGLPAHYSPHSFRATGRQRPSVSRRLSSSRNARRQGIRSRSFSGIQFTTTWIFTQCSALKLQNYRPSSDA